VADLAVQSTATSVSEQLSGAAVVEDLHPSAARDTMLPEVAFARLLSLASLPPKLVEDVLFSPESVLSLASFLSVLGLRLWSAAG
jgi:hypothetical protein